MECCSSVAVMRYGPSKRGMNLATRGSSPDLYVCRLCAVDKTTRSPTWNGKLVRRCQFSWCACVTFAAIRLSCASIWMGAIRVMTSIAEGSVSSRFSGLSSGGSIRADFLKRNWNGV